MSYYGRRQSHAAGPSWRKWGRPLIVAFEDPDEMLDQRFPVALRPWYEYKAGAVGFLLIMSSLGALLAVFAR